jgi:hypothetical protein
VTAWTTGAAILAHAGTTAPDADETAWAGVCALAVNAGMDHRLAWAEIPEQPYTPPQAALDELAAAALITGAECYARREAPLGLTGYADLQGAAVRIARDYLEAIGPMLDRWRYVASGIG